MDRRDRLHLLPDPAGGHRGETCPGRHSGQVSLFFHLGCNSKNSCWNTQTIYLPGLFLFLFLFLLLFLLPFLFLLLFLFMFLLLVSFFLVPFPPFLPNPCSIPVHFIAHLYTSLDTLLFHSHSVCCFLHSATVPFSSCPWLCPCVYPLLLSPCLALWSWTSWWFGRFGKKRLVLMLVILSALINYSRSGYNTLGKKELWLRF